MQVAWQASFVVWLMARDLCLVGRQHRLDLWPRFCIVGQACHCVLQHKSNLYPAQHALKPTA